MTSGIAFPLVCRACGLPEPVAEYRFHAVRLWRFDFAWVAQRVALECDGGIFSAGRHVRPRGFLDDIEKLNEAALDGWLVVRCSTTMLHNGDAIALVRRALQLR